MESFTITDRASMGKKPPSFYFDTPISSFTPSPNHMKSVRFSLGKEGLLASQDYRAANAIGASAASTLNRRKNNSSSSSSLCSNSEEEIRSRLTSASYQRKKQTMSPISKANGGNNIKKIQGVAPFLQK